MSGSPSGANYTLTTLCVSVCVWSSEGRAAVRDGKCSPPVCVHTGKVEARDYTSQIIDKVSEEKKKKIA